MSQKIDAFQLKKTRRNFLFKKNLVISIEKIIPKSYHYSHSNMKKKLERP